MRPVIVDERIELADIDNAAAAIFDFTDGMGFDDYLKNKLTQAAVERKFEIIGRALGRLHKGCSDAIADVPGVREIIDFRDLLLYRYELVKPEYTWNYSVKYLPEIHETVRQALCDLEPIKR